MSSMLSIRKLFRSKLRSSFEKEGQNGKDRSVNKSSEVRTIVNEEYREAFRTKSYTDISERINQGMQLMGARISLDDDDDAISSPLPPPPPTEHVHLSEFLVELSPETLASICKKHKFLMKYLDVSLEAGRLCESTLEKTQQLRVDFEEVRSMIKFIEQKLDSKQHKGKIYRYLASFAHHANPFSSMTKEKFQKLHDIHKGLYQKLASKCEATKRKKKLMRWMKKTLKIVGSGALAIALLLLAMHGVTAAVAAVPPGVIMSSCGAMKRGSKKKKKQEGVETQLVDAAAMGTFVLFKGFDTMGLLVGKLNYEIEQRKVEAEKCVSKGSKVALKELVRDFKNHECWFLEQMEELEEITYLCFLDINRSRRMLIQELDN